MQPVAPPDCAIQRPSVRATLFSLLLVLLVPGLRAFGAQSPLSDSMRLDETIRSQVELIEASPGDSGLLVDLGNLLVLAHRGEEAEAVYRRVLASDPSAVDAAYNLALLLQETGRAQEALELHELVIQSAPDTAWSHYQIGRIHERKGEKALALDAYIRAFSLNPELAFPDVNPHVLENSLATEALLRSNSTVLESQSAPRSYVEGHRIAQLLAAVDESTEESEDTAEGDSLSDEDSTAGGEVSTLPSPGSGPVKTRYSSPDSSPAEGVSESSITEPDLDSRDAGSESPPPGGTTRLGPEDLRDLGRANRADTPAGSSAAGTPSPSSSAGTVRTAPRPRPTPSTPGVDTRSTPPPPATGSRFRPGRRSSAQLDLELLPSEPGTGSSAPPSSRPAP